MRDRYEVPGDFTKQKIDEFWDTHYDNDDDDYGDIIDYLNKAENFRTFDEGLTEFIKKHGYVEEDGLSKEKCVEQRVAFLLKKMKEKNISISKKTLEYHFSGEKRPDVKDSSRKIIFKLCFAMDLDVEETTDFFNKIYFDRTFNVKNIDELVYYFCIKNKKSFTYAEELIKKVKNLLAEDSAEASSELVYTNSIREKADVFTTEEELIRYVLDNKNAFNRYNVTAIKEYTNLLNRIQGKKEDKEVLDRLSKVKTNREHDDLKKCGLVVQDFYKNNLSELTTNMDIASVDFMLYVIYGSFLPVGKNGKSKYSFAKNAKLLKIIKSNFPSKKTISDANKEAISFEAMRKILILLEFYAFCFDANEADDDECIDFFDDFKDQMNDILDSSGMGPLYVGNPYDWLFLYCAKCDNPLDVFRSIIDDVCALDDEN